jgi:hypothetical protein
MIDSYEEIARAMRAQALPKPKQAWRDIFRFAVLTMRKVFVLRWKRMKKSLPSNFIYPILGL